MLSERLARWQFWLLYIGFILTFGPMHIAGMLGMPRRIYTYEPTAAGTIWNQIDHTRGVHPGAELLDLRVQPARFSGRASQRATIPGTPGRWSGRRPRRRRRTTSRRIPTVHSRRPLWDLKHPDDPDWKYE